MSPSTPHRDRARAATTKLPHRLLMSDESSAQPCPSCGRSAAEEVPVADLLASYLTPTDLVAVLRGSVNERTLANWRCDRRGPAFTKVGNEVFYAPSAVRKWFDDLTEDADKHWRDAA